MVENLEGLEALANRIQKSTKTKFAFFCRAHNYLRRKSKLYYKWHLKPWASRFHIGVLGVYSLILFASLFSSVFLSVPSGMEAAGVTFYVDDDSTCVSSCGSQAQPFKTISEAITAMSGGDTVNVAAGTYSSFSVPNTKAGTAGTYTKFIGSPGAVISGGTDAITLGGTANYVRIEGFEVTAHSGHGILTWGADYLQIVNNNIHGGTGAASTAGVYISQSIGNLIDSNTISDNGGSGVSGLDISTTTISHNTIHNNFNDGIVFSGVGITIEGNTIYDQHTSVGAHSDAIVLQAPDYKTFGSTTGNIIIRNNTIYDVIQHIYITSWGAADTLVDGVEVYNNLSYAVDTSFVQSGIVVDTSTAGINITNLDIYNNTVSGLASTGGYGFYPNSRSGGQILTCNMKNNILNNSPVYYDSNEITTLDMDYNLFYQSSGTMIQWNGVAYTSAQWGTWKSATGLEAHGLNADPLLDADNKPQVGSPAIDVGVHDDNTPDVDKEGNPRTGVTDIGAYEYGNIYVATTGNDTTGDGTINNPYLTIRKGVIEAAVGGAVNVAVGTYPETKVLVDKQLIVRSPGAAAVGGTNSLVQHGFNVTSASNISGFEIGGVDIGSGSAAINVSASNVTINDNYIHDIYPDAAGARTGSYEGIRASGAITGVIIEDNIITRTGHDGINFGGSVSLGATAIGIIRGNTVSYCAYLDLTPVLAASVARGFVASDDTWGVDISIYGRDSTVEHNTLSWGWQGTINSYGVNNLLQHNWMEAKRHPDSRGLNASGQLHRQQIYEYPPATNNRYDANYFADTAGAQWEIDNQSYGTNSPGTHDILVYITNNVFAGAQGYLGSLMLSDRGTALAASHNIYVYNNTFLHEAMYLSGATEPWPDGSIRVKNNIFAGSGSIMEYNAAEHNKFDHDYNLYAAANALPLYGSMATNEITADPLMDANYRPQSGSPAINAGVQDANTPTADKDGNPRVGATDIGAYEYQGAAPVQYTLTYNAGSNGSITGTTPQTIVSGGDGSAVTAVPATGYHFVSWSDSSIANPRTDVDVSQNITVTANFAINTYTLTYVAGSNGTVTGTLGQTVDYGASGSAVTAIPNTGYHFVNWSDTSTNNPRTDTNVTGSLSVTANFAITSFSLTTAANPLAGGTITGAGSYEYGTTADIVATANAGYTFDHWSGDCTGANTTLGVLVDDDKECIANFTLDVATSHDLTLNVSPSAAGTLTGAGNYTEGDTATITAFPAFNYTFASWSGDCVGTDNPTMLVMDAAKVCTASFTLTHIYDVGFGKYVHTESGATFSFGSLPDGVAGIDIVVTPHDTATHQLPTGKTLARAYEIEATDQEGNPVTTGLNLSMLFSYTDPKDTDTILYWDGSTWSSDGISNVVRDVSGSNISFATTHFSEFAIFADVAVTGTTSVPAQNNSLAQVVTTLPVTGEQVFPVLLLAVLMALFILIPKSVGTTVATEVQAIEQSHTEALDYILENAAKRLKDKKVDSIQKR